MACLLSTSDHKDAKEIAEEIRGFVESLDIKNTNSPDHQVITISIGLSIINSLDEFEQDQIMTMTEEALGSAKSHGGNTVCLAVKPQK
jgi:PleD family two-component response regulator